MYIFLRCVRAPLIFCPSNIHQTMALFETSLSTELLQQIRATSEFPRRLSVFDTIKSITGNVNPRDVWNGLCQKFHQVTSQIEYYKFPGRGQRDTPVCFEPTARWIARKVLCAARMPLSEKKRRLEMLGCDHEDIELEMRQFTEEEIMQQLEEAFRACGPLKQFGIGPYRIDMYLVDPKIALECDERGHGAYDALQETQRQEFIESQLGCTFIRFDPYAPGFSVMSVVREVVQKLVAHA